MKNKNIMSLLGRAISSAARLGVSLDTKPGSLDIVWPSEFLKIVAEPSYGRDVLALGKSRSAAYASLFTDSGNLSGLSHLAKASPPSFPRKLDLALSLIFK
jgi:hypothetical protein